MFIYTWDTQRSCYKLQDLQIISYFFVYFFIGVQFASILHNTQCSSHQVLPSVSITILPTTHPPTLLPPLVRFPELGVFMFCLPFWYFLHISSPFPYIPFHYYLYSPNEWDHMFVLLRLTYFTQHHTLQVHPRWSKWVFVVFNGWVIFHWIHKPHHLYPFIFRWTPRLLPQFGYCGHCCYKHRGAGVPAFHCICIFIASLSPAVQLLGRRAGLFFFFNFLKDLFIYDSHTQREREAET